MKENVFTGNNNDFHNHLKQSINQSCRIDIIVSFIMESGINLIIDDLIKASTNNAKIRILTSTYLNITQPEALYIIKEKLPGAKIHFYDESSVSFHPKSYIFCSEKDCEIYIGSSNISRGALTTSIEWNYHFKKSENREDFDKFSMTFEDLFNNHSIEVTDKILRNYSKNWIKPKIKEYEEKETTFDIIRPNEAQKEALYHLNKSRMEGYDKALVVAATGIGKTYIAAFDTKNYKKILFVAHREEIIRQAAKTFKKVYPNRTTGYFYKDKKDTNKDVIFALIQTLGKKNYLNDEYFKRDEFDYIIVDEFHHAVASNYTRLLEYFQADFLLGLTATPERLDNRDVFALCDYNNVYEIRLKEAINKGYLSPFRYYGIYDDTINYDTIKYINGKYDEKDLEQKLMIHKRAQLVIKHYKKYNIKRCIAFCSSINHAEYMAKEFNKRGIASAAVYSGSQGKNAQNRQTAIKNLEEAKINVIFTVDMFNEGVDIASIDTVLFLRPTQSPTIFLQQLGRGLRKDTNKKYLTVLDFIGNYKKANMAPFLLSGQNYESTILLKKSPIEFEYPEDCRIDFEFELINLFKKQSQNKLSINDKIKLEYENIKKELKHRPTRKELFIQMDENTKESMKKNRKQNIFKDYLAFLEKNNELLDEEKEYIDTIAYEFLHTIETTKLTKSYKIPIFLAFYNKGQMKMEINEDDIYNTMKEFYNYKTNGVDMLKDKTTKNYKTWTKKEYIKLATKNPIHFLNKSSGKYFIKKEGCLLALNPKLEQYLKQESFKKQYKDIINYLTISYYKERYEKRNR